jgi:tetratricopeptide (TPR) repeat protein
LETIDPAASLNARGLVAENRGQNSASARYRLQALTMDPEKSNIRSDIGNQLARLGLFDEARHVDPKADEYIPLYELDWEAHLRINQAALERSPDSLSSKTDVLFSLYLSGRYEEAAMLSEQLWDQYGTQPAQLGFVALIMAETARRTERPTQAARYRDVFARVVEEFVRSDLNFAFRYYAEARLAVFDGREQESILALERAIDRGLRWSGWLEAAAFESLGNSLEFQGLKSRMAELAAQDRQEILSLLCAPDEGIDGWTPAEQTCASWEPAARSSTVAPT